MPEGAGVHVVIAGCGRVGSQLARELSGEGHSVAIIDKDRRSFRRLGEGFSGEALHGIVFAAGTLELAGIRRAQAFIAVTSGDNSNIVSARTAKERYAVEHVVARIYDPARGGIPGAGGKGSCDLHSPGRLLWRQQQSRC
jgi:trk system potassium uptake protein